jgi:hypothetical protein
MAMLPLALHHPKSEVHPVFCSMYRESTMHHETYTCATVNNVRYEEVLTNLLEAICMKNHEMWVQRLDALAHWALLCRSNDSPIIALQCFTTHCSLPVLLRDDFYLLLLVNDQRKGCNFNNTEEVHVVSKTILQKVVHDGFHQVSNSCMNNGTGVQLLKDSTLKATALKGFSLLPHSTYDSCPKLFEDFTYITKNK